MAAIYCSGCFEAGLGSHPPQLVCSTLLIPDFLVSLYEEGEGEREMEFNSLIVAKLEQKTSLF